MVAVLGEEVAVVAVEYDLDAASTDSVTLGTGGAEVICWTIGYSRVVAAASMMPGELECASVVSDVGVAGHPSKDSSGSDSTLGPCLVVVGGLLSDLWVVWVSTDVC